MKKKTNKKKQLFTFPQFKKEIKDFLMRDEGKITKKDILKIGGALVILNMMLPSQVLAQTTHSNNIVDSGHHSHFSHASHGSHSSHGSHGSHGSHSNHGNY